MDSLKNSLVRASYEGIAFPCSQADFNGGNASKKHVAYLVPGAAIETTGLEPYTGALLIPFINNAALTREFGVLFPDLFDTLRLKFKSKPIGTLSHPYLGPLNVHIDSWSSALASDNRGGMEVTVQWSENNASVSDINFARDTPASPQAMQEAATRADSAIAAVRTRSRVSLRSRADTAAAAVARNAAPQEVSSAFSQVDADAEEAAAYEEVLAATSASITALTEIERFKSAASSLRSQYTGVRGARVYVVPFSGMSLSDISLEVYGNLTGMAGLAAANALVSTEIRAGRRLIVP